MHFSPLLDQDSHPHARYRQAAPATDTNQPHKDNDENHPSDELGRDRAEIVSDHDSDEIDYPDDDEGAGDE